MNRINIASHGISTGPLSTKFSRARCNEKSPFVRSNAAKPVSSKKGGNVESSAAHPGEVVGIVEPPAEPSRLLIAYR